MQHYRQPEGWNMKRLRLKLPVPVVQDLDKMAEETGHSASYLTGKILEQYFNAKKKTEAERKAQNAAQSSAPRY